MQLVEGHYYNCDVLSLFELGSLHHDYYLLNMRLPIDENDPGNKDLGQVKDAWLVVSIGLSETLHKLHICFTHYGTTVIYYEWRSCFRRLWWFIGNLRDSGTLLYFLSNLSTVVTVADFVEVEQVLFSKLGV